MPSIEIDRSNLEIPKYITLADPEFYKPSEIDLLIGVKLFYKLLCVGQISLEKHPNAVLQKTRFGWIVAGEINGFLLKRGVQCHFITHSNLDANLTKFWEVEELPSIKLLSKVEQACEAHFRKNTKRDTDDRYIVRLPFNERKAELGESWSMALHRFHLLEKRFENKPSIENKLLPVLR